MITDTTVKKMVSAGYSHGGNLLKIGAKGKYKPIEAHYPENLKKELKSTRMLNAYLSLIKDKRQAKPLVFLSPCKRVTEGKTF